MGGKDLRARTAPIWAVLLFAATTSLDAATTGTVVAAEGAPLEGALVQAYAPEASAEERQRLLRNEDRVPLASASTDDRGRFTLDAPDGRVLQLIVELDGHAPWAEEVQSGAKIGAIFLRPARRTEGEVVLEGRPLTGARVAVRDSQSRVLWVTTTDDRGRFWVADPAQWAGSVTVLHPGIAAFEIPSEGGIALLEPWSPSSHERFPARLEVPRGLQVSGRVIADGLPVAGAEISSAGWPLALTDEEGRFAVRTREGAELRALAGARSGSTTAAAASSELTISLGAPRRLRVTVAGDDGRGIAGAALQIFDSREATFGERAVADLHGHLEILGLPPTNLALWVAAPGHVFDEPFRQVDLRRVEEAEVRMIGTPQVRRTGRVVDSAGRAVAGALVMPSYDETRVHYGLPSGIGRVGWSDDDGGFELALSLDEERPASLIVLALGEAGQVAELGELEPLEVVLPPGVESVLEVTDPRGRPLAGVTVAIVEGAPGREAPESLVSEWSGIEWFYRTDIEGRLRVRLRPGTHQLAFRAPGFAPLGVERYDAQAGSEPSRFALRPGAVIEGRVVTTAGSPLEGTLVQAQGETTQSQARSDAAGRFRFDELPAGSYVLFAFVPLGMTPDPVTIEAPARGITLMVDSGLTLTGLVFDSATGSPIADAEISAEVVGTNKGVLAGQGAQTDRDGRFELRGLRAGRVALRCSAPGFLPQRSDEVTLHPEEPQAPIEVGLERGVTLAGTVSDEGGRPLADVNVDMRFVGAESDVGEVSSDGRGEYVVEGLPPGRAEVVFHREDFVEHRETIELGEDGGRLEVVLERGGTVRGVVRDAEQRGLEGARVGANRRGPFRAKWVESDERGAFEVQGLAAAEWEITVSKSGFVERKIPGIQPARQGMLEVVLERQPTGVILGMVRGGDRARQGELSLWATNGDSTSAGEVQDGGSYRIEEAPTGDVTVQVSVSGPWGSRSLEGRVVVPIGGRARLDFDLDRGLRVHGRVVRAGEPVLGAQLQFTATGSADSAVTQSGAGGWFEVEVEPGRYQVSIWSNGGGLYDQRVEIHDSSDLEIDISGATLLGRVVDGRTGEGLGGTEVKLRPAVREAHEGSSALPEVTADNRGQFSIHQAPAGRFLLSVRHPDFAPQLVAVELASGSESSVEIALEPAAGLEIALFDARTATPLEGPVVVRESSDAVIWDGNAPWHGAGVRVPLGPGEYKVSVSASGYASLTLAARVPAKEPLRVGLTPGGTVVVRSELLDSRVAKLIAPSGEEYVRCWCNKISAFQIEGSETVLENIAPGSYSVVVFDRDGEALGYPIEVLEGLITEVAVR